jgi:hypothetical protein
MSDTITVNVKIGVTFAPREIELAVEDIDSFAAEFERAMASDDPVWWVTDSTGRRRGLVVDKVSYVDIAAEQNRTIGFSG